MEDQRSGDELSSIESTRPRMRTDRPTPVVPLLLLAAVVGGIVVDPGASSPASSAGSRSDRSVRRGVFRRSGKIDVLGDRQPRAAFALMILIARHQGYRTGIWVDRSALVKAGVVALAVVAVAACQTPASFPGT